MPVCVPTIPKEVKYHLYCHTYNKEQILTLNINPNSWKIAYYYSHAEPFPYKFYLYCAKTGNTRIETDIFDFANYSFLKK